MGGGLGMVVATAGDVNGDHYDDVIVGAPVAFDPRAGTALVFHGSAQGLSAAPDWVADGAGVAGDWFGAAVASGDLNGDGYDDVMVGAPFYDLVAGEENGVVVVWLGSASGLTADGTAPDATIWASGSHRLGWSLDILDSGPAQDPFIIVGGMGSQSEARAGTLAELHPAEYPTQMWGNVVWWGRYWADDPLPSPGHVGPTVTGVDFDGDGVDEVVAGDDLHRRVLVWANRATPGPGSVGGETSNADWVIHDPELPLSGSPSYFGRFVSSAGDVDGDGFEDLLVAARLRELGTGFRGPHRAYLFRGSDTGPSLSPDWSTEIDAVTSWFDPWTGMYDSGDRPLRSAGDVNGDGFDDIIMGAPYYSQNRTWAGRVMVWLGGAQTLSVALAGDGAGSVASADGGIACGADCEERYAYQDVAVLEPTPGIHSLFADWSGACGLQGRGRDRPRQHPLRGQLRHHRWELVAGQVRRPGQRLGKCDRLGGRCGGSRHGRGRE